MIIPGFSILSHPLFNLFAGVAIIAAAVWLFRE